MNASTSVLVQYNYLLLLESVYFTDTDMKALKLSVGLGHMTEDSMVIGRCTIPDLSGLSELQPYEE